MVDSPSALRADARRNTDQIRLAALQVFKDKGLTVSLDEVARVAGVSKGTIFNRFGGRLGLIDAVIEDIVEVELSLIIEQTRSLPRAQDRLRHYVRAIRDLLYRNPAVNDVLLQEYPHSQRALAICHAANEIYDELVAEGHAAGVLAAGFVSNDLHAVIVDTALALKHGEKPDRADYDRRTGFILAGITA